MMDWTQCTDQYCNYICLIAKQITNFHLLYSFRFYFAFKISSFLFIVIALTIIIFFLCVLFQQIIQTDYVNYPIVFINLFSSIIIMTRWTIACDAMCVCWIWVTRESLNHISKKKNPQNKKIRKKHDYMLNCFVVNLFDRVFFDFTDKNPFQHSLQS